MKYQKSTLKIYTFLINNMNKKFVLDHLIKSTGVGRTIGFDAIRDLHNTNIISIQSQGRQRIILLKPTKGNLKYKLFLDELKFRKLPKEIQFLVNFFSELSNAEMVVLFGSFATKTYTPKSDVDILVIGNKEKIMQAREKTELISNRIINTHFLTSVKEDYQKLRQGLCIKGFDKYLEFLSGEINTTPFFEIIDEVESAERNFNSDIFLSKIENAEIKLSYLIGDPYLSKQENLENLYKVFPILKTKDKRNKLKVIKDVIRKVGERLFI